MLVLVVLVVFCGQESRDVSDALGDALSEEKLGAGPKVLGMFEEAEGHHGPLARPQLVLPADGEARVTNTAGGRGCVGSAPAPAGVPFRAPVARRPSA